MLLLAVFLVSLFLNVRHYKRQEPCSSDTLRVTVTDTIPFYKPVLKDSTVIRYVTEKFPVNVPELSENVPELPENVPELPESATDSIDVVIPIAQAVYEDSLYTAYVSGYQASLDSLILRMPREVTTVTYARNAKNRRWGIGIQAGYGITLKGTPQLAPYIGIGISYNLFSF